MGGVRYGNLWVAVRCGNLWVAEMEAESLWGPRSYGGRKVREPMGGRKVREPMGGRDGGARDRAGPGTRLMSTKHDNCELRIISCIFMLSRAKVKCEEATSGGRTGRTRFRYESEI